MDIQSFFSGTKIGKRGCVRVCGGDGGGQLSADNGAQVEGSYLCVTSSSEMWNKINCYVIFQNHF